ncbi:HesA/MoeB/ThiF family protein [Aspergillus thermomutatus]|uniref:Adenylyltransferase and sulfurtransferase uba4 n=1 Tax=Aspergillus thermomutatus TaxID=41047 RepID=A0A397HPR3_ASPTH|nr:Urmylation protein [Aspergillus thermomutatus]RHZ63576.1 Urmylation protein [Aspergillus thermomutatus]
MENLEQTCASLRAQIAATEAQLAGLKRELEMAEQAAADVKAQDTARTIATDKRSDNGTRKWPLLSEEYKRYGRQMIVPQLGLPGQLKLRSARVLIVGAGGLGCPAALYLAGAGVGTLGLVDGDTVENSNLHRQVLHRSKNVGKFKVDSAIEYLRELNPHPTYVPYRAHLTPQEAPDIFKDYDLILDCTDNPATRYLISDIAVLVGKPLVSASALRTEGQLMVLNYPPRPVGDKTGGPCYRCVFPKPPPANSVVSCADGGILGPVVGTMGVLQALEAIKIITSSAANSSGTPPSLLIFSAYSTPPFRTIKLRSRRAKCAVCSADASVTLETLKAGSTDYVFFCGVAGLEASLLSEERISPLDFRKKHPKQVPQDGGSINKEPTIIDVREKVQFDICNLENSINIPISTILSSASSSTTNADNDAQPSLPSWLPPDLASATSTDPIYVVCRLGNDSQIAVRRLKELGLDQGGQRYVGDIQGGLRAWREQIDPDWPEY